MVGVCDKWVVSVLCACSRACSLCQRMSGCVFVCARYCFSVGVRYFLCRTIEHYSTLNTRPFTHPSTALYKCFVASCVVVDVMWFRVVGVCGKWVVPVLCACSRACSLGQRCDVLLCLGACLCVRVIASLLA